MMSVYATKGLRLAFIAHCIYPSKIGESSIVGVVVTNNHAMILCKQLE